MLTIHSLFTTASDNWRTERWVITGFEGVLCLIWVFWMFVLLYCMARVTDVGDSKLRWLKCEECEELREYVSTLIERDPLSMTVATQRWSLRVFNGLIMGLMLALHFIWLQQLTG